MRQNTTNSAPSGTNVISFFDRQPVVQQPPVKITRAKRTSIAKAASPPTIRGMIEASGRNIEFISLPYSDEPTFFNANVIAVEHGNFSGSVLYVRTMDGGETVRSSDECAGLLKRGVRGELPPDLSPDEPVMILGSVVYAMVCVNPSFCRTCQMCDRPMK